MNATFNAMTPLLDKKEYLKSIHFSSFQRSLCGELSTNQQNHL